MTDRLPLSSVELTISGEQAERFIKRLDALKRVTLALGTPGQDGLQREIDSLENDADWLEEALEEARRVDFAHELAADRQQAEREEAADV